MDISKIVFGEKFRLEMPVEEVNEEGVAAINALLIRHGNEDMIYRLMRDEFWPSVWSWRWSVPSGDWVGNLPKRIQSFCYKLYRKQLLPAVISEIGNIASANTNRHTTWLYDFDKELAWNAGEYGDTGSCFWTEKPWCLPLLKDMGGFAIRVYDPQYPDNGMGRGLVIAYDPVKEMGKDPLEKLMITGKLIDAPPPDDGPPTLVVFNGYGEFRKDYVNERGKRYGHMQSMDYARLLAQILGQSYHKTQFSVNGNFGDPMYINNDGTSSFLVGPDPLIRKLTKINITVAAGVVARHKKTCPDCGHLINIDPARANPRVRQGKQAPDGYTYCENCYKNRYVKCYGCAAILSREDAGRINSIDGEFYACPEHFAKIAKPCSRCKTSWAMDELQRISAKRNICPECWSGYTRGCHHCRRRFLLNELTVCHIKDDEASKARPVRVCKNCLGQQDKATKTGPKYLPVLAELKMTTLKARYGVDGAVIVDMSMDSIDVSTWRPANSPSYFAMPNNGDMERMETSIIEPPRPQRAYTNTVNLQRIPEAATPINFHTITGLQREELIYRVSSYQRRLMDEGLPTVDFGRYATETGINEFINRLENRNTVNAALGNLGNHYSDADLSLAYRIAVKPAIERWQQNEITREAMEITELAARMDYFNDRLEADNLPFLDNDEYTTVEMRETFIARGVITPIVFAELTRHYLLSDLSYVYENYIRPVIRQWSAEHAEEEE